MIADVAKKCNYVLPDGSYRCPRPADPTGRCVLHDPNPGKNQDRVNEAIKLTLEGQLQGISPVVADFRGCHFFGLGPDFRGSYDMRAVFDDAVFHENVNFSNLKFVRCWTFQRSVFKNEVGFSDMPTTGERVLFTEAVFRSDADFSRTVIGGLVDFDRTEFHGKTSFAGTQFQSSVRFLATQFLGEVDFTGANLPKAIRFVRCNFSGVRVLSLHGFPGSYDLHEVTWPKWSPRWLKALGIGRLYIYDEVNGRKSLDVLNAYRRLHKYYYDRSEFDLASEFYVSFMVLKRRAQKARLTRFPSWLTDLFYSLLSRYGESVTRPFLSLVALWLVVPVLLSLAQGESLATVGYWNMFWDNLMASTIYRTQDLINSFSFLSRKIIFVEIILNAILFSMLVLGIRRTFVPKKPLDESQEVS